MTSHGHDSTDPIETGDVEQLTLEILRLRDIVRGCDAQVGELTTRLARLDEQRRLSEAQWIHRMEHTDRQLEAALERVDAIESSRSWRIGQLVLTPVRWWRKLTSS